MQLVTFCVLSFFLLSLPSNLEIGVLTAHHYSRHDFPLHFTLGIEAHVTLHNIDLPQALDDEHGGWISGRIIKDLRDYADVCFREFGDRVLYWTTVNEPNVFALAGYDQGSCPPLRCSSPFGLVNCTRGNSTFEAYLAAHNILLAHSSVAKLYRTKYKHISSGQRTPSNSSLYDVSRVLDALRNGSNVRGFIARSFMDIYELLDGYKSSYGLYYVDRNDPDLKSYHCV
ncbi:hydroxyisourate hydrolase-like isoform X2 [Senna tora]|uniref:Hydroxyisourate hydrolase-like isoform X2 n=1 Tax=Senna tora TaxID=362788 RepID=A0A834SJR3_9FABA|nr:hydroxyisourate hydrolase-like isoform X2 [Senna tora]